MLAAVEEEGKVEGGSGGGRKGSGGGGGGGIRGERGFIDGRCGLRKSRLSYGSLCCVIVETWWCWWLWCWLWW